MASSGTITGNQVNRRPYLSIYWRILEQDIPGNRSKVRLELRLHSPYPSYFSASKSGKLEGQSFTYTGGFSGTGTKTVRTRDIWVGHNSDGSKTATFDGSLTLNIYWREDGVTIGTISVSGDANLDSIPRKSTIKSISGSQFGSSVTVSADVKYSGFSHKVVYRRPDGATFSSSGLSFTPPLNDVQYVPNATYANVTVTLETYNGSTRIGTDSKTHRLNVPSSVVPTFSGFSASELESRVQDVMAGTAYVAGMSRARFTRSGASGARGSTIKQYKLSFQGSTYTNTGSTYDVDVTQPGSLTAQAWVVDSRGRESAKRTITLTSLAYSPPSISSFRASRRADAQTVVDTQAAGTTSSLNGRNTVTLEIEYRETGGYWTTAHSRSGFTGDFDEGKAVTDVDVAKSYEFRVTVRDSFRNEVSSGLPVSTAFVVMDYHEDKGVGFGKMHERGVLDIAGEIFMNGIRFDYAERFDPELGNSDTIDFWQSLPQGLYFVSPDQLENQPTNWGFMNVMKGSSYDYNVIWYEQATGMIYRKSGNNNNNYPWQQIVTQGGSNSNGRWVRFADGTQICAHKVWISSSTGKPADHVMRAYWTYPVKFKSVDAVVGTRDAYIGNGATHDNATIAAEDDNLSRAEVLYFGGGFRSTSGNRDVFVIAVGRWY